MMTSSNKGILSVLASGLWVNISEFVRNEVLLKSSWVEHYQRLGMTFPSAPVNGMVWIVWGFLFAVILFALSRKFSLLQTVLIGWVAAFVLMWLVIGNLNILPEGILFTAVPLSLLETFIAAYVIIKIAPATTQNT